MFLRSVEAKACLTQDMKVLAQSHFSPNNSGNNLKYTTIFPHIDKSITFYTLKSLLLFVYTHNINKIPYFCKIKKKKGCAVSVSGLERLTLNSAYRILGSRDKYIYRKLEMSTLKIKN